MDWQEAIKQSSKGTATRTNKNGEHNETFVRYKDSSGYKLIAKNGKTDFAMSGELSAEQLEGFDDWQPS